MRKLLILSIALSVFLCACGSTDSGSTDSSSTDSSKQEGTTTTAYSTPESDDPLYMPLAEPQLHGLKTAL